MNEVARTWEISGGAQRGHVAFSFHIPLIRLVPQLWLCFLGCCSGLFCIFKSVT
jgi:hypothetical protein